MQRVGEMSDALHRFRSYMWSAESLEKAKEELRSPRLNAERRKRLMYVIAQCERSLDAGWREVGTIAERDGDAAAELVAGHFLFGEDWHDLTASLGISYDKGKKVAYAAIKALDRF